MTQLEARNCYLVPVILVATILSLLVHASDAQTALRWGKRTVGNLHDFVVTEEAFDTGVKRRHVRHVMCLTQPTRCSLAAHSLANIVDSIEMLPQTLLHDLPLLLNLFSG